MTDTTATFDVRLDDDPATGSRLVVGLAAPGMVGLTTADYLASRTEATQVGRVVADRFPTFTPFSDGVPRHPIRLYAAPDLDATVLVGEAFLPLGAAEPFVDALVAFAGDRGIEEVTVLHGIPFQHGPEEHAVFTVATPTYRERRLADDRYRPLRGGFVDGAAGELLSRGLEPDGLPAGALVTPAHPPGPDFEGALLTLSAVADVYGVEIDDDELRRRSEETRRYYHELADRMRAVAEDEGGGRDYREDRMFM